MSFKDSTSEQNVGKENREQLLKLLRKVAPGTSLREGLENILRAGTGALIVLSDKPEVMKIVEGGFEINAAFTPAALYELARWMVRLSHRRCKEIIAVMAYT